MFFVCFNLLLGWEGNNSRSSESPLILSLAEVWGIWGREAESRSPTDFNPCFLKHHLIRPS